jgi:hypothetical protein
MSPSVQRLEHGLESVYCRSGSRRAVERTEITGDDENVMIMDWRARAKGWRV